MPRDYVDPYQINKIIASLRDFALRDVLFISNQDAVLAAFMIASCFIDQLGGIRHGSESSGKTYKKFIKEYLPQCDRYNLYEDLRCKLVHNYSLGNKYSLIRQAPELHLVPNASNQIYLNIENFVSDLKVAFDLFVTHLNTVQEVGEKATKWSRTYSIIQKSEI
jgi:hypothetical protein